MGRKHEISIAFPEDLLARMRQATGPRGIAKLVRAAVHRELARRQDQAEAGELARRGAESGA